MEDSILQLDHRTDQSTKVMLQNVLKRKRKFDRLRIRHLIVMWMTTALTVYYLVHIYQTVAHPYSYSFAAMFSAYVNSSQNFYLLVFTLGSFGFMNLLRDQREKAEKEFHALRCEIIDKSKDLWKSEDEWKNRHIVFEMMKKKYDINLYHENK